MSQSDGDNWELGEFEYGVDKCYCWSGDHDADCKLKYRPNKV